MYEIGVPIIKEYLYPTGAGGGANLDADGYEATGREGPLGYFTCSECGAVFEPPDYENYAVYELEEGVEIDCECKKTWVSVERQESFYMDIVDKSKHRKYFPPEPKNGTSYKIYQVHLNHGTTQIVTGPVCKDDNTRGTLDSIRCPQCGKRFNPHQPDVNVHDTNNHKAILCNCDRTYALIVDTESIEPEHGFIDTSAIYAEYLDFTKDGTGRTPTPTGHVGTMDSLACGWCGRPFHFDIKASVQEKIICTNCGNRAALLRNSAFEKSINPHLGVKYKATVIKDKVLTKEQQNFVDNFFIVDEEEEVNTTDPLNNFFK